ncbi:MAG: hypothetical protein ACI4NW_05695 [Stenotrophomonas sp.]
MLRLASSSVRHCWFAGTALLLLAACGRNDTSALQGAATEPAAAVRQLADYLQQGDLAGFARAAVPPAEHAQLAQAWSDGDSLWPLTSLPLDDHLPELLAVLAADNAQADLQRAFKAQFEGQGSNLRQTAHSLGMFGVQYVGHQGDYTPLQREHYRQLVTGLSRWASQAALSDPALAQAAITRLTTAVADSGLDGVAALQAAGMQPALEKLGPVQQALFDVLASYDLDLRQSLAGLQVGLLQEQGEQALVQVQYPLAGQLVSFQAQMQRVDGRWYMAQNLADARRLLAAAQQARAQRQAEAPEDTTGAVEAAEPAAQDGQMASAP